MLSHILQDEQFRGKQRTLSHVETSLGVGDSGVSVGTGLYRVGSEPVGCFYIRTNRLVPLSAFSLCETSPEHGVALHHSMDGLSDGVFLHRAGKTQAEALVEVFITLRLAPNLEMKLLYWAEAEDSAILEISLFRGWLRRGLHNSGQLIQRFGFEYVLHSHS